MYNRNVYCQKLHDEISVVIDFKMSMGTWKQAHGL